MPTTSSSAARRALEGLEEGGVRYAVLHAMHKLSEGNISDVDVTVAQDPRAAIELARPAWSHRDLSPILFWPYDIGGTLTVFLASGDGREGVQLDMLYDPDGVGKYGVRSSALVDSAVDGEFPVVSEPARLTYLWRKRQVKGQGDILETLRSEAAALQPADLMEASKQLTGTTETAQGLLGLRNESPQTTRQHRIAEFRRLSNRLLVPIGHWAHLTHRTAAEETAALLARYLIVARAGTVPKGPRQLWWYATRVRPTILRPGVFLSYGTRPTWCPPPFTLLTEEATDEAAPLLITAMSERVAE